MRRRPDNRWTAVMLVAMASIAAGLTACGPSDAAGRPSPASAVAASTTPAPVTGDSGVATADTLAVTDAEVADLEKQLDEIDQLLDGVGSDLSHD
ncbi:MAG: hypothetical protein ABI949_14060 [Ilumatobacteraceae bacterium]